MKKLFVLTSILALGAVSTFAQGLINANNQGTGINVLVQDTTGVINAGVAAKIGTPATAAGFTTAEGKGAVTISLYAAASSASLSTLESAQSLVWTGLNSASGLAGNQGTFAPGTSFVLPTATGLDGSAVVQFVLFGVSADGAYKGWSNVGSIQPTTAAAAQSGTSPVTIYGGTGITGLTLVPTPEPATIALGGLGAAALLLFRRRK
jgi:hypothetical protein